MQKEETTVEVTATVLLPTCGMLWIAVFTWKPFGAIKDAARHMYGPSSSC